MSAVQLIRSLAERRAAKDERKVVEIALPDVKLPGHEEDRGPGKAKLAGLGLAVGAALAGLMTWLRRRAENERPSEPVRVARAGAREQGSNGAAPDDEKPGGAREAARTAAESAATAAVTGTSSGLQAARQLAKEQIHDHVVEPAKEKLDERVVEPAKEKAIRIGVLGAIGLTIYLFVIAVLAHLLVLWATDLI